MRRAYLTVLGLLIAALVVQLYLAGVGAFDRPRDDGSFALHRFTGMVVFPVLILVATALAAANRLPGRLIGLTLLPLGVVILQALIGVVARVFDADTGGSTLTGTLIFGLHALNGMVVGILVDLTRKRALAHFAATTAPVPAAVAQ
jgi:hypothetical protein